MFCPSAEFGWALPLRFLCCLLFKILFVEGLLAPGRTRLEVPSTSLTSLKPSNTPSGTFSSFM
jgi:hypothetical protein